MQIQYHPRSSRLLPTKRCVVFGGQRKNHPGQPLKRQITFIKFSFYLRMGNGTGTSWDFEPWNKNHGILSTWDKNTLEAWYWDKYRWDGPETKSLLQDIQIPCFGTTWDTSSIGLFSKFNHVWLKFSQTFRLIYSCRKFRQNR